MFTITKRYLRYRPQILWNQFQELHSNKDDREYQTRNCTSESHFRACDLLQIGNFCDGCYSYY